MANNVVFEVQVDSDKAKASLTQLQKKFKKTGDSLNSIGKKASIVFAGLAVSIAAAVFPAANFEEQMFDVAKVTNLTDEEIVKLSEDLQDLSFNSKFTATELAGIAAAAGQLGIQGSKDILEFTRAVGSISQALDFSTEEAATALARISSQFKVPIKEIENLGSAINELSATTSASAGEITTAILNTGSVLGRLGFAKESIAGLVATFITLTGSGEAAATALNRFFSQASTKFKDLAVITGKTEAELKALFDSDPTEFFILIQRGFAGITSEAEQTSEATRIFGIQGAKAILGTSEKIDELVANLKKSQQAYAENESIQKELEKVSKGFNQQLKTTIGRFKIIAIQLGNELLPIFKDFFISLGKILKRFTELSPQVKKFIAISLLVTTAIVGFIATFGLLGGAVLNGIVVFQLLRVSLLKFAKTMRLLPLLMGPIGIAIAVVSAVIIAAFLAWKNNLFGVQDRIKKLIVFATPAFKAFSKGFISAFVPMIKIIKIFAKSVQVSMATATFVFKTFETIVERFIDRTVSVFKRFGSAIKKLFKLDFSGAKDELASFVEDQERITLDSQDRQTKSLEEFVKKIKDIRDGAKDDKEQQTDGITGEGDAVVENALKQQTKITEIFASSANARVELAKKEAELLSEIQQTNDLGRLVELEAFFEQDRQMLLDQVDFQLSLIEGQNQAEIEARKILELEKQRISEEFDKKQVARRKKQSELSEKFNILDIKNLKNFAFAAGFISKEAANVFKAISLGEAIISLSRGIVRALAEIPFPASLGAIASITAAAAPNIAAIASQQFQQGASNLPDDTLGLFSKKEIVVPTSFSEGIRRGDLTLGGPGSGGGGGSTQTNNFDFSGSSFTGFDNDDIIDAIEERLTSKSITIGSTIVVAT